MTLEEASQSLLLQIDQYLTRRGMRVKISKAMCSIKIEEWKISKKPSVTVHNVDFTSFGIYHD